MKRDSTKEPRFIELTIRSKSRSTQAIYQCQYCMVKFTAVVSKVISGKIISCGCQRRNRRADHTKRKLSSWGSAKTLWIGQRFLSHSKLQPRARAEADKQLMKQLGIKDRDILFKAAHEVHKQTVSPSMPEVDVELSASRVPQNTPCDALQPVTEASAHQPTPTTVINNYGPITQIIEAPMNHRGQDITTYKSRTAPTKDIPYEQTENGYLALGQYWKQFKTGPPEGFDLEGWNQQRTMN